MCYPATALRKEKKLWDACYAGNIDQVKEITAEEGVNLNWRKPDTSVSDLALHFNSDGRLQPCQKLKLLLELSSHTEGEHGTFISTIIIGNTRWNSK